MQVIDQAYDVKRPLGQGLMGEVYLVERDGKPLALKLLKEEVSGLTPRDLERHFKAEFTLLRQLDHPHIARIVDFGQDPQSGRYYFTSEYISGGDLRKRAPELSPAQMELLLIQALRALSYLQSHGISHFDLKPENLLLTADTGAIKIIDFGMAGLRPRSEMAGTPAYLAPEFVFGQTPDARADLYSLAICFYECLTGENPFRGKSLTETLRRHETLTPPPLHERNAEISPALSQVIAQMMEKNPADRPLGGAPALRLLGQLSGKKIMLETEATVLSYLPKTTRLVGRAQEMAAFSGQLKDFKTKGDEPERPILIVTGPPGIGKTRLLEEMRFKAQLAGLKVIRVARGELPELQEPSVLIFEDLTAAEVRKLPLKLWSLNYPVLVLASSEAKVPSLERASVFALQPFNRTEIEEYLAILTGFKKPPPALVEELERRTQGIPGILTEILEESIRHGYLLDEDGRWTESTLEDLGVDFSQARAGEGLQAIFQKNYAALKPDRQKVLQALATSRGGSSAEDLAKVLKKKDITADLLELVAGGFLERSFAEKTYAFHNPFLKSWLLEQIPPGAREEWHGRWTRFWEERGDHEEALFYHRGRSQRSPGAARDLFELARLLERRGEHRAALEQLRLAEAIPGLPVDQDFQIQIKIGEDLITLRQTQQALAHFKELQKKLEQLGGGEAEAAAKVSSYEKLGTIYLGLGQLDEAEGAFQQGLQLLETQPQLKTKLLVFKNYLGRILFQKGELKKAAALLSQTRKVWREKFTEEERFLVRNNDLGMVQQRLEQLTAAEQTLQADLKFLRKVHDEPLEARCLYNLAQVKAAQDDLPKAIDYYRECIELSKGQKNFNILLRAYNGIGNLLFKQENLAEALEYYQRALAIARKVDDFTSQAALQLNMGMIHNRQSRPQQARPYLQAVIHLLQATESPDAYQQQLLRTAKGELAEGTQAPDSEPKISNSTPEPKEERKPTMDTTTSGRSGPSATRIAEHDLAKLLELTRMINSERNLDFVLNSVLQNALEIAKAERGLILLVDEKDRLEPKAAINTPLDADLSAISTKVAEQVLKSGQVVETDDASSDQRFNEYESVMLLKLRSILCLPIHSRNKTVGILYLDHRYQPAAFRESRLPLLQAFCDQVGIAIENARLFEQYERAQAQLKEALAKVTEEKEHYHELLGETGKVLLPTKYSYDNIVARSKPMYEVFKLLDKITETNIAVFINGETGTGKELIAKALHYNNRQRAKGRFVAINCGGIPPNLIESELFGYKAGAFTGASRDKKGLFVEANGGTLFMDEISDLDLGLQVKLLRALEEGEVIPVGDTRPIHFDIRVVSASHKNLEDLVAQGSFREDLFYRLCQIRIPLPPLRDRQEDIQLLVDKFLKDYAKEHHLKKVPQVSTSLMKRLIEYDWPGNIRELENTIRVCAALSDGKNLTPKSLPDNFGKRRATAGSSSNQGRGTSKQRFPDFSEIPTVAIDEDNDYHPERSWEDYQQLIFAKAFAHADFKPVEAAKTLGVSPATFYKRIKDYHLSEKGNPLYNEEFNFRPGKNLREYLEDIVWAAYQAAEEKSYTAIRWLGVSQGHFYNILKSAKKRKG